MDKLSNVPKSVGSGLTYGNRFTRFWPYKSIVEQNERKKKENDQHKNSKNIIFW